MSGKNSSSIKNIDALKNTGDDVVTENATPEFVENGVEKTESEGNATDEPKTDVYDKVVGIVSTDCDALNVRHEPNTDCDVVSVLRSGSEVIIDEDASTNDFYKVCTPAGLDGYCMKQYITLK